MANKFDLNALKASNFEGAARTHVEKAYIVLTGEPEESIVGRDLEELREACRKVVGLNEIREMAPPPAPEGPKLSVVGRIPNLGPTGKWEGRMRRVMVVDPNPDSEKKTVSVAWEGRPWDFAYGVAVDMPWPYWNALKDAVARDEASVNVTEWERDKKGRVKKVTTPTERPVHNYQDLGDVPGTEALPESYFDFFRRRARDTGCFRDLRIPMLLLIHERLYDGPPRDSDHKNVQLDAITLRLKIAERLGPEFVSQINSEMFEAA